MRWILSMTLLLVLAGICGCAETECERFPEEQGEQWKGVYDGEMEGQPGGCGDSSYLDGNVLVDVLSIEQDPDDEDVTIIKIKLTYEEGEWTLFSGWICDKEDDEVPLTYAFSVTYSENVEVDGYQISRTNTLSGFFVEEYDYKDEVIPAHLDANYNISIIIAQKPEDNCTMQASLRAELVD